MALTLSKTGIDQSQTINAWHVTQSIDALAGTQAYDITISGSFVLGTGTTGSGYFTNAVTSNQIRLQNTAGNTNYTLPYLASTSSTSALYYAGTGPVYNPVTETLKATNFEGTASLASTASYAEISQVSGYYVPSGSAAATAGVLKFFAGASKTSGTPPYTAIVNLSPINLTGKILNQNLFLGTTPSQSGATVAATVNSPTAITFVSNNPNVDFTFIATYI
jgi:hypothetical protein